MLERQQGGPFPLRERESKDAYLTTYFANVLDELDSDLNHFHHEILLRKLLLSYLALYIAQIIGVDYHAATEELYYLLRKDDQKNTKISDFINKLISKIKQS